MASDDSWLGRTLAGRYSLLRRIGSGGMSTVYEATDEQLGRNVAVKLFPAGEARDDSRRRAEVDVLARLNHPNLVTMYDAHLASGDSSVPSFLVMELVAGPDLRSTLDHGPLLGGVAARVAADIAGGLAAMHAQGIVHRDLKPANILLAPTGLPSPTHRAKLADFGIAHLVGADRMTTVGTVIGTASYLSPEQATGAAPGPASDIYALGLVVLEGLTGRREYPGTIVESMSARASRDPVISDALPAGWVALLTEMTARDPDARPSALDVAARAQHLTPELEAWGGFAAEAGGAGAAGAAGAGASSGAAGSAGAAAAGDSWDALTRPMDAPTAVMPGAGAAAGAAGAAAASAAAVGGSGIGTTDDATAATVRAPSAGNIPGATVAAAGAGAGAGASLGAGVGAAAATTAAQTAATRVDTVHLASATPPRGRSGSGSGATSTTPEPPRKRGRRIALLAVAAAAVLVAGTWIGGTLLTAAPSAEPGSPAATTPAIATTPPSTPAQGDEAATDDGGTDDDTGAGTGETVTDATAPAPAPGGGTAPTAGPTAPVPTVPAPVPTASAPAPAPSDPAQPAPTNGPGNSGNGNGNNGNGNGNNGNGNGKGGPGKG